MVISINKKLVVATISVLLVVQLVLLVVISVTTLGVAVEDTVYYNYTVVIDAGHGGIDGGVVGVNGTKESDLNLAYSKTLGKIFSSCGFNVVYTRTGTGGLYGLATAGFKKRDMQARKEIIEKNNADMVISVHMNKYQDSSRSGPQVFFQEKATGGQQLASSIQTNLNNKTGNKHSALSGDFYICRCSGAVSVIVECGFLSNPQEEQMLNDSQYQEELMQTVFGGVMLYLYNK